jgi:deferrochelatase/peroxidase EfeB
MLSVAAGLGLGAGLDRTVDGGSSSPARPAVGDAEVPFYGQHQAGIATPAQGYLQFAAFDLLDTSAGELRGLLERWTQAAAVLTRGGLYEPVRQAPSDVPSDPGEATDLSPARLTLTFGFGPGLFRGGRAQLPLAARRPTLLEPLPAFAGDELDASRSGGDLCVQACADHPQVAFHAIHVMSLLASPTAVPRWTQTGFRRAAPQDGRGPRPRNLIGFKDGTDNIRPNDASAMARFVWVQRGDGPAWMAGGTYLVVRRIDIQFPSWDRLSLEQQEQTIGRHKLSGAPLGAGHEADPVNLDLQSADGALAIPQHAHIRQANPANNSGERILRRSYNYSAAAEPAFYRPGAVQGGLFFIAFVRDPARQFVPLQRRLATKDALSAFTLHTASALFACPPGIQPGGFVGEGLLA